MPELANFPAGHDTRGQHLDEAFLAEDDFGNMETYGVDDRIEMWFFFCFVVAVGAIRRTHIVAFFTSLLARPLSRP